MGCPDQLGVLISEVRCPHFRFSHNRGECFVKQLLDTTEFFSLSRGLLMDPRASSLTAFMMGVEGNETGDEWRMITLNFKRLLQRKCEGGGEERLGFCLRISCSLSLQAHRQTIRSGWSTSIKMPVPLATETPTTLPNLCPCELSSAS